MEPEELAGWLRLTLTPDIGRTAARRLLAAFGLPAALFQQTPQALRQVVSEAHATALLTPPARLGEMIDNTLEWLHGTDATGGTRRIVTLGDAGYPASLLEMADPPLLLYVLGAAPLDLTQLDRSLAIVGSRNPTPQGVLNARAFARAFSEAGLVVVSGLALGVDGAAHAGALEPPGDLRRPATVAVVGTGLDRVYPARHRALAHRIAERGLIVSEFALGTPPLNQNFPRRNRIIAGLTRGTLVVEAALQSGSLITARLASEQGRDVYAIPGSIHSPQSRGCHALIRQGAKLVETVDDVLEEFRVETSALVTTSAPDEDSLHAGLLQAIGHDPVSLDALGARTGDTVPMLQVQLLELELAGQVTRLPGGLFQRIVRT